MYLERKNAMNETVGWQYQVGSWYQENGGYVIVFAMIAAAAVWFFVKWLLRDKTTH